jgi:hypothetical protein
MAARRRVRKAGRDAVRYTLALLAFHTVAGTILRQDLWQEPLGRFLKNFPVVALHYVTLAIIEER